MCELVIMSIIGSQFHTTFVGKSTYNKITKKANRTLRLLHRTLSPCSKEVKSRAHQTLVRPQLEYAAEARDPYNITTADRLEHIQHSAACFVHHDY